MITLIGFGGIFFLKRITKEHTHKMIMVVQGLRFSSYSILKDVYKFCNIKHWLFDSSILEVKLSCLTGLRA